MGNKKDPFGNRMKEYENVARNYLTRRMPVCIRIDGKSFHSFTCGFVKPFDDVFAKAMESTMKYLCENIQGCVLGYTQSDEITLILIDYKDIHSCAWFDNNIQKMVSVSASMATMAFNRFFKTEMHNYRIKINYDDEGYVSEEEVDLLNAYSKALNKGAMFDSRVFTLPKEEVVNCLIWRQQDATRNSVEAAGHAYFSQNQLHKKNNSEIQDMLMLEKGINWNDYPVRHKRGACCIKMPFKINEGLPTETIRNKWVIDYDIPIFTQNRDYINDRIYFKENV